MVTGLGVVEEVVGVVVVGRGRVEMRVVEGVLVGDIRVVDIKVEGVVEGGGKIVGVTVGGRRIVEGGVLYDEVMLVVGGVEYEGGLVGGRGGLVVGDL